MKNQCKSCFGPPYVHPTAPMGGPPERPRGFEMASRDAPEVLKWCPGMLKWKTLQNRCLLVTDHFVPVLLLREYSKMVPSCQSCSGPLRVYPAAPTVLQGGLRGNHSNVHFDGDHSLILSLQFPSKLNLRCVSCNRRSDSNAQGGSKPS